MTWWPALALSLGCWTIMLAVVAGETWVATDRRNRIVYVPWLPLADAINAVPGLTLIHRKVRDRWPHWKAKALVEHERIHTEQRRRMGWLAWWALYGLSVPRRLKLEAEAYAANARRRAARPDWARAVVVDAYARLVRTYSVWWWPPDWVQAAPEREAIGDWIEGHLP